jgi:hypothetical protein
MDLKQARTEASIQANSRKVNHVIVQVAHGFSVYTEKQYPKGYYELVEPELEVIKCETTEEAKEVLKPRAKKQV